MSEPYDGTQDYVVVNTWMYTVEQYLSLSQLSSPNLVITDHNKISFASSYLKNDAAIWWYHKVNSVNTPSTLENVKTDLLA